jgi:hypothetical protein
MVVDPAPFLRATPVAQTERLYSAALHSRAVSLHHLKRCLVLKVLCQVLCQMLKASAVWSSIEARYWDWMG